MTKWLDEDDSEQGASAMDLPFPVQAFFQAEETPKTEPPIYAFAPTATVRDEGRTHTGHQAIANWWSMAKAEYQHVSKPLEVAHRGDMIEVRAQVAGRFPGSPAILTFTFRLTGEAIAALEIGA